MVACTCVSVHVCVCCLLFHFALLCIECDERALRPRGQGGFKKQTERRNQLALPGLCARTCTDPGFFCCCCCCTDALTTLLTLALLCGYRREACPLQPRLSLFTHLNLMRWVFFSPITLMAVHQWTFYTLSSQLYTVC